jgi:hypothetical protein
MSKLSMLAEARSKIPASEVPVESAAATWRMPGTSHRSPTVDLAAMPEVANTSLAAHDDEPDSTLVFVRVAPWALPLIGGAIALGTACIWWTALRYA